jgi:C1A family cysteine protease
MKLRITLLALAALLATLATVAGLSGRADSTQSTPRQAPPSAAFVNYVKAHQASGASSDRSSRKTSVQKAGGSVATQGSSLAPTPIDFSYLRDAKVQIDTATYPATYDLRTRGKLGSVKDQGYFGTCWAFAALGSLESCLRPSDPATFSEDNLVRNAGFSFANPYDEGGTSLMATAYLVRWAGPVAASEDAYGDSYTPAGLTAEKHVQEVLYLPPRASSTDNASIKWAVKNHGAIYTSIYADGGMTGSHLSSFYNPAKAAYYYTGSKIANHSVNIVGWNDNYSASNFAKKPPGKGAFIVRNSWGSGWGDGGYFYVSYYDRRIGREGAPLPADGVSESTDTDAVFDDAEAAGDFNGIYQYDPLGWTTPLGYPASPAPNTAWFANSFTAASSNDLAAVSFYAAEPGSSYTVYVSAAASPSATMTASGSGILAMAGYHTVMLATPVPLVGGQSFTVAVKLTTPGYDYPIPLESRIIGYTDSATASPGQGFVSSDGVDWTDLTDYYPSDSVCLKAFTRAPGALDITPPITKATGTSRAWRNTAAVLTLSASDTGSGVAYTKYQVDGKGRWRSSNVVSIAAPSSHAKDGVHTVLYRSIDLAGNFETQHSRSVKIDTRRPTAMAPASSLARRGSRATLRFEALDMQPSLGACQMVITVKSLSGQVKATFAPSTWYRCGRVNAYRFICHLAPGKYRFSLTARDGAGNLSTKAASNYLTVL